MQPQGEQLRIFISYARRDSTEFAEELLAALELAGFEAFVDRHDIAPGEDWELRLQRMIGSSHTVVFVISPASIASKECARELAHAQATAKRIIPVVAFEVDAATAPEELRKLNWVFFTRPNGFARSARELVLALRSDVEWIREHTRLHEAATRWQERGRQEVMLLRGVELETARTWLASWRPGAPEPTAAQREYVAASADAEADKLQAERQRLQEIQNAQAQREIALKRLSRRTALGIGVAAGLTMAASGLAYWGWDAERRFTSERVRRQDLLGKLARGTLTPEEAAGIADEVVNLQFSDASEAEKQTARLALTRLAISKDPDIRSSVATLTDAKSLQKPKGDEPDAASNLLHSTLEQFARLPGGLIVSALNAATGEPLPVENGRSIIKVGEAASYRVQTIAPLSGELILIDRQKARAPSDGERSYNYLLLFPNSFILNRTSSAIGPGQTIEVGAKDAGFKLTATLNDPSATVERGDIIALVAPRSLKLVEALAPANPTRGFAADMDRTPATIAALDNANAWLEKHLRAGDIGREAGAATIPYEIRAD